MQNQEYGHQKQECWEEFKRDNLDGEVQWQPVTDCHHLDKEAWTCTDDCPSPDHIVKDSEMVDSIIKDGVREHNRLHIATQMASAILGSEMALKRDGKQESKTPANVASSAFEFADALLSECEKGGQQ